MLSRVWSATTIGIEAIPIEIETNVEFGMPKYTVVGLPNGAVRESRDRVQAAMRNSGFTAPRGVITINLAPADLRKEGSAFDLPIALGLLAATGIPFDRRALKQFLVVGELSLDGHVRAVRGVLPMAVRARREGMKGVVVPVQNAGEAVVVDGIGTYPVRHLTEAVSLLSGNGERSPPANPNQYRSAAPTTRSPVDFSDVKGQESAKRALEVAAAGGHNVLMTGSPGAGKTMLARRLPTILPDLTREEALETTTIHSVGGRLHRAGLVVRRPFRSPHHTISDVGLCGGGSQPRPGEISMAHNGVLFLDEFPEFKRRALEVLRQPMEEGRVSISRARISVEFPARFILVASMNPCPCGYLDRSTSVVRLHSGRCTSVPGTDQWTASRPDRPAYRRDARVYPRSGIAARGRTIGGRAVARAGSAPEAGRTARRIARPLQCRHVLAPRARTLPAGPTVSDASSRRRSPSGAKRPRLRSNTEGCPYHRGPLRTGRNRHGSPRGGDSVSVPPWLGAVTSPTCDATWA